jgi:hypothetical protein
MIINRLYETQNLLPLYIISFLVGLRTYQHYCTIKCCVIKIIIFIIIIIIIIIIIVVP